MFTVIGYADRLSARPGQTIEFMTSTKVSHYDLRFVRLVDGVHQPLNSKSEVPTPTPVDGRYEGKHQAIVTGSYVRVPDHPLLRLERSFTFLTWLCPTTPAAGRPQCIAAKGFADEGGGYAVLLTADGDLCLRVLDAEGRLTELRTGTALRASEWYFVACVHDADTRRLALTQEPLSPWLRAELVHVTADSRLALGSCAAPLLIAAESSNPRRGAPTQIAGSYNGKLEAPQVWSRALAEGQLAVLKAGAAPRKAGDGLVAAWAFDLDPASSTVRDVGPHRLDGEAVNCPSRAVTGHCWNGATTDFRDSPEQYAAIHFHEEDLAEASWDPTISLAVPSAWQSGVYAARIETADSIDYIPFIVKPSARSLSPIAVVMPTLTYLAYANRRFDDRVRDLLAALGRGREVPLSPHEAFVADHPELGLSLYDRHIDGHLCAYSSRLRPIIELRPDYYHWITGTPRHFSADLHLLGWLESRGYCFDVFSDDDLHVEGVEIARGYEVLITGSHPEYVTTQIRDALGSYVAEGGKLMYLGGNGFYWVASLDPDRPHIMEVRRGHAGTGEGYSAPGEGHHSTTGEPGGLWRLRGKPPQTLVGVGFTGQGWVDAAAYRLRVDSRDPRASFIFEGVAADEPVGAFGPMGGAAGDELDRADAALGTPSNALVVASSQGLHSDSYQGAVEDVSCMTPGYAGTANPNVRADMVFAEMPQGGAVFSVGSIAWCLSLAYNGGENNVARITANVLDSFIGSRLAAKAMSSLAGDPV